VPRRAVELAAASASPTSFAKSGGTLTSLVVGGLVSAAGFRAMAQVLVLVLMAIGRRSGTTG
jgi:hypothetical protein